MSFLIRRVYQGLLYRPKGNKLHPISGLLILTFQFLMMISSNTLVLGLLFLFILLENAVLRNVNGALNILRAVSPLLIIIGILSYTFGNLTLAINIILRISSGAIGFSLYFAFTNPSDLSRSLENLKIPSRLAMIPALGLMLIPRVIKDAEETYEALLMRGEIKGRFYHWLPRMLAIFIASILYRSEFLAQSLYYRGFALYKRTHYRDLNWKRKDFSRVILWAAFLVFSTQI